jgi:phytoene dehydrogenase-like protein
MERPAIVGGAGIGGLNAARRVAAANRRVPIPEQNPAAGGTMSAIREDGFGWDMALSAITMRHVNAALNSPCVACRR